MNRRAVVVCSLALSSLLPACDRTKAVPETPPAPSAQVSAVASSVVTAVPSSTAAPASPELVALPPAAETLPLANASNALAFDLYRLVKTTPGNLAMSPASISAALAMTYGGARGETEAQMKRVLHLEGSREATMSAWGTLAKALQSPDRPLKLRIANRLFGDKSAKFEPAFLEQTRTAYAAPLEALDFKTGFEPARVHINGWVEDQTEKRIRDLLAPGALTAKTRLVLVNAIYFLGDWAQPFKKEATVDEPFKVAGTTDKKTPMMHAVEALRVAKRDGMTTIELPYRGESAAMFVFLPDQANGLAALEATISAAKVREWTTALTSERIDLSMPRFEVSPAAVELRDVLVRLGVVDAFDVDKADFTGIVKSTAPDERLSISSVVHKAFVKVDEKGTEAAAATVVAMGVGAGMPAPPKVVRVDHPFLYAIMDKATGLMLFLGRVTDPTTK